MKKLIATLAHALNDEEKSSLSAKLMSSFGESEIEFHVDEAIIGGIVVFDGDSVYDGSIKGMLDRAAVALKK